MSDEARSAILGRIRQALSRPAPAAEWEHEPVDAGPLFPLPEPTTAALWERFAAEFAALGGEAHWCSNPEEAEEWSQRFLADCNFEVLAVDDPLTRRVLSTAARITWVGAEGEDPGTWDRCGLGITPAESLVAESGTIVVSAVRCGRAPSVLCPIHLVVATADQLVPDLETSIERLRSRYGDKLPSSCTWISGPSRTADIEKILVLGAHGPKRLVLLMIGENKPSRLD